MRLACRAAGLIENIHGVSHGKQDKSTKRAAKFTDFDWAIQGYANWTVNGHRELSCSCGNGTQGCTAWLDEDGTARVDLRGRCGTCGSITLLRGQWRRAKSPDRYVPQESGGDPLSADRRKARQ